MRLTESQKRAYSKFSKLKVGALFMQQGTGKTRVAVELANTTDASLVLFIVPNALKDNIKTEIEKWQIEKPYFIETYEGVASSDRRYTELIERLKAEDKVMAIADESIKFKNRHTKTTDRMMKLREFTEYRLALNGTPITRDEWDLYSQMNWLSPKILNMSEDEFKWTFFRQVKFKRKGERERVFYEFSEVNANYLQELIAPYIFQVDLNFGKKESEAEEMVSPSLEAYEKYIKLKEELLDNIAEAGDMYFVNMLRQMEVVMFSDEQRIKWIANDVKDKGQIIVFCNYLKEVEIISNEIDCYVITGEVKDRAEIIESFKNDNKPLVITLGTGSFGLNLQFCNQIAFASLTFDYGKIDQAKHRIKRLGQERDITYTYYESPFGLYNMIKSNLSRKKSLKQFIKEAMEKGELEKL